MKSRTRADLQDEIEQLQQRIAELGASEAGTEEKWREVLDCLPDHIMTVGLDGSITFINYTVPGVTREDVLGKPLLDLVPQEFRESVKECYERVRSSGNPDRYFTSFTRPDGITQHFEAHVGPLFESGKITGFALRAADITERRRAEEGARAANEQLRASEQQLLAANQQLGAANQQLEASNQQLLAGEQQLRAANQQLEASNQQLRATEQQLRASNQQLEAANQKLRESEENLEGAIKIAHVGSWDLDVLTGDLSWSDETYRIYGFEPQEFIPTFERFQAILHPDDLQRVLQAADTALSGAADYDIDFRIVRPDRKIGWIHCDGDVTRDAGGKPLRFFGTQIDITERRQSEQRVRELNQELEQRVLERTRDLEAVIRELESFAYSVSHDLRAPLRAVEGFSQALLEDYPDKLNTRGKDYLQRVSVEAQRMAQLINDLLELSRVTRAEMRVEQVDISAMAQNVMDMLRQSEPEREINVVIAGELSVDGDSRLLRQVMENLLGNAWKFTGSRPGAEVEFGTEEQEGRAVYFVRDNGVGFDMRYADKLFIPFQRLHGMKEFPGTGIGLSTVHRIVTRHGGRVWFESEVDRGSTFYFTLHDVEEVDDE